MYYIRKWNKQWGKKAKFVVENNGVFAEFSLSSPKDIVWVSDELPEMDKYKDWDDWKREPVESLDLIVM